MGPQLTTTIGVTAGVSIASFHRMMLLAPWPTDFVLFLLTEAGVSKWFQVLTKLDTGFQRSNENWC